MKLNNIFKFFLEVLKLPSFILFINQSETNFANDRHEVIGRVINHGAELRTQK